MVPAFLLNMYILYLFLNVLSSQRKLGLLYNQGVSACMTVYSIRNNVPVCGGEPRNYWLEGDGVREEFTALFGGLGVCNKSFKIL